MRITILGDIMLKKEQLEAYRKDGTYDLYPALRSIEKFVKSDFIIANLESPIAGEQYGYTDEPYCFNSPIELVKTLKKVGVDMVQTCNNHCMDRGVEGLKNTISNLDKIGLKYIGTRKKPGKSYKIVELDGIRVGFLAFTYGTNAFSNHNYVKKNEGYMIDLLQPQELTNPVERWLVTSNMFLVRCVREVFRRLHLFQFDKPIYERTQPAKRERENLVASIKECREAGADYLVMMLHVGGQYNETPTDYTKSVCELCRECGVNAVMANHEHVIHPIEKRSMNEHSFCEYSLGNFFSDIGVQAEPYDKLAEYSAVYHIDLNRQEEGVEASYSVELFINHLVEGYGVVTSPIMGYLEQTDPETRQRVRQDYQILMNRIMGTEGIQYLFQKEHRIEVAS